MDEFFYEEENTRGTIVKIIGVVIILLLIVGVFSYYRKEYALAVNKEVTYEVGDNFSLDITKYVTSKMLDRNDYKLYYSSVPLDGEVIVKTGKYSYKVKYKNVSKKGTIVVLDTKAPVVETKDLVVGVNEEYDIQDFLTKCDDYSKPCNVEYKNPSDENLQKKKGVYSFDIVISDGVGNSINKKVRLDVKENYSLEKEKKSDLNILYTTPEFEDFNGNYVVKLKEGVDEDYLEKNDGYLEVLFMAIDDLHPYISDEYANNEIVETDFVYGFNKYHYVVAIGLRVKLDNGVVLYLTK